MKLTAPQLRVLRLMKCLYLCHDRHYPSWNINGKIVSKATATAILERGLIAEHSSNPWFVKYELTARGREAAGEGT